LLLVLGFGDDVILGLGSRAETAGLEKQRLPFKGKNKFEVKSVLITKYWNKIIWIYKFI
jgi:hypothetical protein